MTDTTGRLALPMILPGQAQKEMTHNEALALLDIAVQASVIACGTESPPAAATDGDCWIIGDAPTGAWAGRATCLAAWTAGGWRFVSPQEGFEAFVRESRGSAKFIDGAWRVSPQAAAVDDPVDGDVVDLQARSAIAGILSLLRDHGFVALP